jgi:hypothetical protein
VREQRTERRWDAWLGDRVESELNRLERLFPDLHWQRTGNKVLIWRSRGPRKLQLHGLSAVDTEVSLLAGTEAGPAARATLKTYSVDGALRPLIERFLSPLTARRAA